jgi:hypothetical protein
VTSDATVVVVSGDPEVEGAGPTVDVTACGSEVLDRGTVVVEAPGSPEPEQPASPIMIKASGHAVRQEGCFIGGI